MLEINNNNKNTEAEMNNAFGGPISRLDAVVERISDIEDMSIKTSKIKKQGEQKLNKT